VVVAWGLDQLARLARALERGGEFPPLALELGGLERAVEQPDRRADALYVPLRR